MTESFLREIVEKLSPAVADIIAREDSGHFQIHFLKGKLTRIRKDVTV